ncbi:DUF1488 domain-containing protein [Pseudoduganella rivuli]|nr:DUF1488 domain-containing protein [Pseudoduganella rivuli]
MDISFPLRSAFDHDFDSVSFPVEIDGKKQRCLITREALHDHFGGEDVELTEAFEANRDQIELVARAKIEQGVRENILLKTADF